MKVSEEKIQEHLSWRCFWRALFFVHQGADSYNYVIILHSSQSTMSMLMHRTLKRLRMSWFEIAWNLTLSICQVHTHGQYSSYPVCILHRSFPRDSKDQKSPHVMPLRYVKYLSRVEILSSCLGHHIKETNLGVGDLWKFRKVKGIPLEKRPDVRDKMFFGVFFLCFCSLVFLGWSK